MWSWSFQKKIKSVQGGLASGSQRAVQHVAMRALKLWDERRCDHTQARRFLDPTWAGLHGSVEPPLRPLIVKLANGEISMLDLLDDNTEPVQLFFYWVSAFRLVQDSFAATDVSHRLQVTSYSFYTILTPTKTRFYL